MSSEPDQFDCDSCEVATHLDTLDDDNREAWALYRACCNRFLADTQTIPVLLAKRTEDLDSEAFEELAERLRVIYDIVQPRKTT